MTAMKPLALPGSHSGQESERKQDRALVCISNAEDEGVAPTISRLVLFSRSSHLFTPFVLPLFQELKAERNYFPLPHT